MLAESPRRTIGHALRVYLPRSQTFVHTLLRHQRRWRPVVLAGELEHLDEFPFDPVIRVAGRGGALPARVARRLRARAAGARSSWDHGLATAARAEGCSALHAHFGPTGCTSLGASELLEVPLLTTFYGFDLAFARENPEWAGPYARLFERGALFACEGPAMAEQLVAIGAPRERVRIVKIGIELEHFPFSPAPRDGPFVVVSTGRFVEKKGFDTGILAFAAAAAELGDAELRIVGDGAGRAELEDLARECGVADRVRFLGMVSHAGYRAALAEAHAGLVPSRTAADGDTEGGAPTVILEMEATGIAVVATRHADIPAVVARPEELAGERDHEALAAALVRVAREDGAARAERLREARALVEREHDARVTADGAEHLYDEMLGA